MGRSGVPLGTLVPPGPFPRHLLRAAWVAAIAVGIATGLAIAADLQSKPGAQVVFVVCVAAAGAAAGPWASLIAGAASLPIYIAFFLNSPSRFSVSRSQVGSLVALGIGFLVIAAIVWRERRSRTLSSDARELSGALDHAGVVVWRWDTDDDRIEWLDDPARLTGDAHIDAPATFHELLELVHQDDRAELEQTMRSAVSGRSAFDVEARINLVPNDWRWVQLEGKVVRRLGRPRVAGLARDVTPRRRAEEREHFLAELTRTLAVTLDFDQMIAELARLAVPTLGDWCSVDMLEPDGAVRNAAIAHSDPAEVELARELRDRFPVDRRAPSWAAAVLAGGPARLDVEVPGRDSAEDGRSSEELDLLDRLGWRSAVTAPLKARGRAFGAVTLVNAETPRAYDESDLVFLEEVAQLAALMLDNASLHRDEQELRASAEATARRVERFQALTARLSAAVTPAEVAETLVEETREVLGARAGWVSVLSEDGEELRLLAENGYRQDFVQKYRRIPITSELAVVEAVRGGEPVWLESVEGGLDAYPELVEGGDATGGSALAIVPLHDVERAFGFLALRFDGPRVFADAERALISSFVGQCAQSLERARLYERESTARAEAERHRGELHFLGEVSKTLSSTLELDEMLDELLRLTVPEVADAVSIFLLEEGRYLRRAASVHVDPAKTELMRDLRGVRLDLESSTGPLARAIRQREPVGLAVSEAGALDSLALDDPQLRTLESLGMNDWYALPLVVRGQALGVFSLARVGSGRFSDRDLGLAREFANRAAPALANAAEFERERSARASAEQASQRLGHLHRIATALAQAISPEEVAAAVVEHSRAAFGADSTAVQLLSADGSELEPAAAFGHLEELIARYGTMSMSQELPAVQVVREGQVCWFASSAELAERFPDHASIRGPLEAVGFIPLAGQEKPLGLLTVSFESRRPLGGDDRALADVLLRQCGQALERARLFIREQEARRRAEEATKRLNQLQAIVEAGLSARSMEELVQDLLTRVSRLLGAERATILLLDEEQQVLRVRAAIGLEGESLDEVRVPLGAGVDGRIAATGEPRIVADLSQVEVVSPYLSRAGGSLIGVPLSVGRRVLGVLNVSSLQLNAFSEDDLELLELAAERAALAFERMMVYEREHQIAITLQQSVLPGALPEIESLPVAVRYLPGRTELEVGGDWYDVIELDDRRVGIVVGDVVGKGVIAAAAMAQLRNALRVYALDGLDPGSAVGRLGEFARTVGMPFATVLYLVIDFETGLCSYASAGHPPALYRRRDWPPVYLEDGRTPPIGVGLDTPSPQASVQLEPGDLLLLYTDGLVESRSMTLNEGLERLSNAVEQGPEGLDELLDHVGLELDVETRQDDVALVAIRWEPAPTLELRLPVDPASLADLRRELRAWLGRSGVEDPAAHDIVVACSEACANAILHAADPTEPDFVVSGVRQNGEISLVVRDFGRWREPDPEPTSGGFGFTLMHALMDTVEVQTEPEGTEIRMCRRLTAE